MKRKEKFFGLSRENIVAFFKMPLRDIIWGIAVTIFFLCCWTFDWLLIKLALRTEKSYIN